MLSKEVLLMNKKVSRLLIVILAIILIIGMFFIKGISFGIGGKFFFTTKYHKTAINAFISEYEPFSLEDNISIKEQVDIVIINENNCLVLATTDDKKLLVASMIFKGGKYAFTGDYYIYDSEGTDDYDESLGLIMNKTQLYNSKGMATDIFEWCIVFDDEISSEEYICKNYTPDNYKSFKLIY